MQKKKHFGISIPCFFLLLSFSSPPPTEKKYEGVISEKTLTEAVEQSKGSDILIFGKDGQWHYIADVKKTENSSFQESGEKK